MCTVQSLVFICILTCFSAMALIACSINTFDFVDGKKVTKGTFDFHKNLQNQLFLEQVTYMPKKQSDQPGIKLKLVHKNRVSSDSLLSRTANRSEVLEQVIRSDRQRMIAFKQNVRRLLAKPESALSLSPTLPPTSQAERIAEPAVAPTQGTDELTSSTISGSYVGSGEYFVELDMGTPSQKLFLIVDTGSDLVWTKCAPCRNCSQSSQAFNSSNSSSFKPAVCHSKECLIVSSPPYCRDTSGHCYFSERYSDQSFTMGILMSETVTLQSRSRKPVRLDNLTIGCATQSSGGNFDSVGGVAGLGQGSLSLSSQVAPAYGNKFSYCFVDFFSPTTVGSSLVFGESFIEYPLQYTSLLTNPYLQTYYYVGVQGVEVNGTLLPIADHVWEIDSQGNGGTILDSGTTLAQFEETAYETILAAFESAVTYQRTAATAALELCYNVTLVSEPILFPEFSITLQGNAIFQPPQDN
eukprot:c54849_g1_i1 orf=501-1904(+)